MDPNDVLVWLVGASCVLVALRWLLHAGERSRGWIAVALLLLLLLGLLSIVVPERAGWIAGSAWAVLVLLPSVGSRITVAAIVRRRFALALRACRLVARLHPWDGWRDQPRLVEAMALHEAGRDEEAVARLVALRQLHSPIGRSALVLSTRITHRWDALRRAVDEHPAPDRVLRDPHLLAGYLRALGEAGERAAMLALYRRLVSGGRVRGGGSIAQVTALHVAALAGRRDVVEQLLAGPLRDVQPDVADFWLATADQVAGRAAAATERFLALLAGGSAGATAAIQQRLLEPLPPLAPGELHGEHVATLDEMTAVAEHERRFAVLRPSRGPARATLGVGLLLLVVFAFELRGGSSDTENLLRMGALVVPVEGTPYDEPWRRLTAGFLHAGPLHLALNLAGLVVLGRWLERAWGSLAFAVCYVVSTVVSMGLLPAVHPGSPEHWTVFVGASGGVMGLFGALLAYLLVGRVAGRSPLLSRQLGLMLVFLAFQVAFDASTPNVSMTCHMIGMANGALFGLVAGVLAARRGARRGR